MQIYGPYRVSTAQPTTPAAPTRASAPTSASRPTGAPTDQLDLSSAAKDINRIASSTPTDAVAGGGEIRLDKVADLRRQIASGNYDTAERLDSALDRMLDAWG
jgi:negative regulator of flagellin synthesis FlgM